VRDYDGAGTQLPIGTILIGLGGGNLGDLYPRYQRLRERVAADFAGHRFVILPQSVHFTTEHACRDAARRLRGHRDLHVAVRDARSVAIARDFTGHVELLPDVVELWGRACIAAQAGRPSVETPGEPLPLDAAGTLHLMRADSERDLHAGTRGDPAVDWPALTPSPGRALVGMAAAVHLLPRAARAARYAAWSAHATRTLVTVVARMAAARLVVTDRLHGAIAARLADKPVQLVDNSYGKLSAYAATWWQNDPTMTLRSRP
jgi:pyruvyl transferase EpsO